MDEKEGRNVLMRLMLQIMFICQGFGQLDPPLYRKTVSMKANREWRVEMHTNVYILNHRLIQSLSLS